MALPRIPVPPSATERLKDALRGSLGPLWRRLQQRRLARYLVDEPAPRLHVGCGMYRLPGWLNADRILAWDALYLDARRDLPLPDASMAYVFSEHFISQLELTDGLRFLGECWRVLKPGGILRTATLGLEFLAHLSAAEDDAYVAWSSRALLETALESKCLVINNLLYGIGHKFIYDRACLAMVLARCGFVDVTEATPGQSAHALLGGVECHQRWLPPAFNELETIVLEARKP